MDLTQLKALKAKARASLKEVSRPALKELIVKLAAAPLETVLVKDKALADLCREEGFMVAGNNNGWIIEIPDSE